MITENLTDARILVVDDKEDNVLLLHSLLQEHSYAHIRTTTDPRRVLPLFIEFQPDLILLDLQMPHLDGFGVMEELRTVIQPESYLPILILTADITRQAKTRALQAGAKDFLVKPLDHLEVLLRIRNLLEARALHLRQQNQNQILEEKVRERTAALARTNAELTASNEQLQEVDHLKTSFINVISHELRTPFTIIMLTLDAIENDGLEGLQPEQRQLFRELFGDVQNTYGLIDNLIKYTEFVNGQVVLPMSEIALQSVVSQVIQQLSSEVESKHLTLDVDIPDDLPFCYGNTERLGDATYQLVKNAIQCTPAGGKIAVRCWAEGKAVHFSVQDTGPGIPSERLPQLWKGFVQLADPMLRGREGLGLGLALVQHIVDVHKGKTWARSQVGEGSTFGFWIPVA